MVFDPCDSVNQSSSEQFARLDLASPLRQLLLYTLLDAGDIRCLVVGALEPPFSSLRQLRFLASWRSGLIVPTSFNRENKVVVLTRLI